MYRIRSIRPFGAVTWNTHSFVLSRPSIEARGSPWLPCRTRTPPAGAGTDPTRSATFASKKRVSSASRERPHGRLKQPGPTKKHAQSREIAISISRYWVLTFAIIAIIVRTMSQTPSFSKLDEVVVPTGTASGAQFCVTLPAKRHGQAVQQRFDLWQGSGCCPKVQPRDVEVNAGKRAEQRPSTRAGRGKCAADQIYE